MGALEPGLIAARDDDPALELIADERGGDAAEERERALVARDPVRHLLRERRLGVGAVLRWERIFDWLDGSVAAAYVYLLLSYLDRHRLTDIAPGVLHEFFLRQRAFGRTNLAILHALLDRYVADGHEFGLLGWMALRLGRQMARPA